MTVVTWFKSRVVLEVVCMTMRTILTPLPPWKSWKHKMGLKWFFENFRMPWAKKASEGPKKGQKLVFSKYLENLWTFYIFEHILQKADKISEILKKISSKSDERFWFSSILKSKKRVARPKIEFLNGPTSKTVKSF